MSVTMTKAVWEDASITDQGELLVLLALADYHNPRRGCFPDLKAIAEKTRMTKKGVIRVINRLVTKEVITKLKGGGRGHSNAFHFYYKRVTLGHPLKHEERVTLDSERVTLDSERVTLNTQKGDYWLPFPIGETQNSNLTGPQFHGRGRQSRIFQFRQGAPLERSHRNGAYVGEHASHDPDSGHFQREKRRTSARVAVFQCGLGSQRALATAARGCDHTMFGRLQAEYAFDIRSIVSRCRQLRAKHGISLVVVDYLQLVDSFRSNNAERHERLVADVSRNLSRMAKELDLVVIALSQLNDGGLLRDSRAIGHDADVILRIEESKSTDAFARDIVIDKQRDGDRGKRIPVQFYGQYMQFRDRE